MSICIYLSESIYEMLLKKKANYGAMCAMEFHLNFKTMTTLHKHYI